MSNLRRPSPPVSTPAPSPSVAPVKFRRDFSLSVSLSLSYNFWVDDWIAENYWNQFENWLIGEILGLEVPAFASAIEAHQQRITEAILNRALEIAAEKNVSAAFWILICADLKSSYVCYGSFVPAWFDYDFFCCFK